MPYWMPITRHSPDWMNLVFQYKRMKSEKAGVQLIRYLERCWISEWYNNQGAD